MKKNSERDVLHEKIKNGNDKTKHYKNNFIQNNDEREMKRYLKLHIANHRPG